MTDSSEGTFELQPFDSDSGVINRGFSPALQPGYTEADNKHGSGDENNEAPKSTGKKGRGKMQFAILSGIQYKVDDNPPWITTILLGFQHYLMLLSSNLATPGIMASIVCAIGIPDEMQVRSALLGNMLFACGICTLLQTFFGARSTNPTVNLS